MNKLTGNKLENLCKYYLNCLSLEENQGISVFLTSQFELKYREVQYVDERCFEDQEVLQFLDKMSRRKNMIFYLGYPCAIERIYSPKNSTYFDKLIPVLLWFIDYHGGEIHISKVPNVNKEIIRKYLGKNSDIQSYELIELENQLGLENKELNITVEELVSRLQDIRKWNWLEKISPETISIVPSISELTVEGIYNRAVIIASEKSPYTLGLEFELSKLSEVEESQYKETALYSWIHNNTDLKNSDDKFFQVLQVLPMNNEQKKAVQEALKADLTIITGPPGTGKSQVVTNLLINMAWNRKNVLFSSKNNKAVDVVETRVNELGESPILLRIGNDYHQNNLEKLVDFLLNSAVDIEDKKRYETLKNEYEKNLELCEELLKSKSELIKIRNELDSAEQKYNFIRDDFERFFNEISPDSIFDLERLLKNTQESFRNTIFKEQSYFIKFFWGVIKNFRIRKFEKTKNRLNQLLESLKINIQIGDKVTEKFFEEQYSEIKRFISSFNIMFEYKRLLNELNGLESLESIDRKLLMREKQRADIAYNLWNNWLMIRPLGISSVERKQMAQYLAAIKLVSRNKNRQQISPRLKKEMSYLQNEMSKLLPCWAVTSLSAKGRIPFLPGIFDLLIIDEASQCDIASILPLLYRAKRAVIIGDPQQLSHISAITKKQDAYLIQKYGIELDWSYSSSSLYNLASTLVNAKHVVHLRDHHRCYKDIIEFSNKEFYNGKLRIATDYNKLKRNNEISLGIQWKNVLGRTERALTGSVYNLAEAEEIEKFLKWLVRNQYKGTIGIVTPFRIQAEKIQDIIERNEELTEKLSKNDLMIDTVHKFQGDERDLIIFSAVISEGTTQGALGFLKSTGNLFNVAITRARSTLYVVGDLEYCRTCGVSYMEHFVKYIETLNEKAHKEYDINMDWEEYPDIVDDSQVSEWEKYFYKKLRQAGIKTIPQLPVDKYKLDLALLIDDRKLDIEIDGEMYHKSWNGELCYRDQLRNQRLIEQGWNIKRFWVYQIRDNLDWCIREIENWIKQK